MLKTTRLATATGTAAANTELTIPEGKYILLRHFVNFVDFSLDGALPTSVSLTDNEAHSGLSLSRPKSDNVGGPRINESPEVGEYYPEGTTIRLTGGQGSASGKFYGADITYFEFNN